MFLFLHRIILFLLLVFFSPNISANTVEEKSAEKESDQNRFLSFLFKKKSGVEVNHSFQKVQPQIHSKLDLYREFFKKKRYDDAKSILISALKLCEANKGEQELDTAYVRTQLGITLLRLGIYENVRDLLEKSLSTRNERLGSGHYFTAETLQALGLYYRDMGNDKKSLEFYQKAFETIKEVKGSGSLEAAYVASALGSAKKNLGDFKNATEDLSFAMSIFKLEPRENARDIAVNLSSLAGMSTSPNEHEKYLTEAVRVLEDANLKLTREYGILLADQASINVTLGRPQKAEGKFKEALRVIKNTAGDKNPLYGNILTSYANFKRKVLNDLIEAEELYAKAQLCYENALGKTNSLTIVASINLSTCMIERGNANGMKLIRTTALLTFGFNPSSKMGLLHLMQEPELVPIEGVSNDFAAQILNSIAVTLNNSAETFKKESNKEAGRKIVNLINDGIASAYNKALQFAKYKDTKSLIQYNQAVWLIDNQPNEAEPLLLNRLKALEESYGNQSPKLESVLTTLTHMYAFSQDKEKSSFYAKRLMRCTQNRIEQILSFTSESERQSTLINPGRYNAFVAAGNPNLLAEFVLKSKGMILDSMMEEKAFLKLAMKPKLKNLFLEIKRTEQLHRIALQNLNSTPLTATLNVKADPDKLNLALKELKKKATLEFSRENPVRKIFKFEVSDLQKKIGANAVMLEFISFDKKIDSWLWERRYGVLIIPAYNLNLPIQWVDLGLAKTIDSEVNKFMELISSENSFNAKKNLQKLYSQLFARLIKLIPEDVNTLIFSPDSSLNFVPFGCLIDTDGKFLSETYGVKYVSTGRDLLDLNIAESKSEGDMVIFANPDFKNEKTGIEIIGSKQELAILHSGLRELSFNPLPGTMLEASALSSIANENKMKVKVYHGRDAKEESLMKIHSPKILHLATHGFFLPVNSQEQKTPFSHRANRKINSMNRGGLLLSGAQKNFELYSKGKNISKSSDGILTAEEVKGLDLSGTWLTSLSACDTASGTVLDGEGVLGLRRSFVQAGTQNLLLTLWSVDDSFTKDFMVSFYKEALKTGNAPKAMAKVQKEWLIKLREERSVSQAVKLAGPFVLTFRGNPELN